MTVEHENNPTGPDGEIERREELLSLAALDALTTEEEQELVTLLADDVSARQRLAEFRLVSEQLAQTIPIVQAPAHLTADLRAKLQATKSPAPAPAAPRPEPQRPAAARPARPTPTPVATSPSPTFLDWLLGRGGQPRYGLAGLALLLLLGLGNIILLQTVNRQSGVLANAQERSDALSAEVAELRPRVDSLLTENEGLLGRVGQLATENETLTASNESLASSLAQNETALTQSESDLATAQSQVASLREEIRQTAERLALTEEESQLVRDSLTAPKTFAVQLDARTEPAAAQQTVGHFVCAPGVLGTLMIDNLSDDLAAGELSLVLVRKDGSVDQIEAEIVLNEDGTGTFIISAPVPWGEYNAAEIVAGFDPSTPDQRNTILGGEFNET